jgi:hypothetical protein
MDTENFIVERTRLAEQLQGRRAKDLSDYPFRMADDYGLSLPAWARLALSLVGKGSNFSKVIEVALPLAVPLLFRKKAPFLQRLVQGFFSRKS